WGQALGKVPGQAGLDDIQTFLAEPGVKVIEQVPYVRGDHQITLLGGFKLVINFFGRQSGKLVIQVAGKSLVLGKAGGAILDNARDRIGVAEVCGLGRRRWFRKRGLLQKVKATGNGGNDQGSGESLCRYP